MKEYTVYNRLSVLRTERGLTRQNLADALEINYQTVGYIERGDYCPSLELSLRMAAFFRVPVEMLFGLNPFRPMSEELLAGYTGPRGNGEKS